MAGKCCARLTWKKMRRRAIVMAAVGTLWIAPAAVQAIAYSWNINASGLFDTATNWAPSGGPPATNVDSAIFDQPGTYTVTFQTSKANALFNVGNGSVAFALSGLTYTLSAQSSIGDVDGQTGRLTLSNGTVAANSVLVGSSAADTGFLTVSTNSALNSSANLIIGNAGTGTLTVQSGGDVTTAGASSIGSASTAFGAATVNGSGSTWTSNGQFIIADAGTGSLSITSGGLVTAASASTTLIGNNTGSEGSLAVSGAGSRFSNTAATLNIGNSGKGSITVSAGGAVDVANTVLVGAASTASGTLTVTGAGSTFTSTGTLNLGSSGTGAVNILAGGSVSTLSANVGFGTTSHGTALVDGSGSIWNLSAGLTVGSQGIGTMTISGGGATTVTGNIVLGSSAVSNGTLLVSGAGSTLIGTAISVGSGGAGTLNILEGGVVTTPVGISTIAQFTGSSGAATVSGAGSTWNTVGLTIGSTNSGNASLTVGSGGTVNVNGLLTLNDPTGAPTGTLTLNTGGTINVTNGFTRRGTFNFNGGNLNINGGIFSSGAAPTPLTVTGLTASDLPVLHFSGNTATTSNVSDFNVGSTTSGAVEVVGGAHLIISGAASIGASGGTGSVLVDGIGSNWVAGGALQFGVGGNGTGSITISNGGTVSSVGGGLAVTAGSKGSVTVTGMGSSWASSSKITVGGGAGPGPNAMLTIADGATVSSAIDLGSISDGALNVRTGGALTSTQLTVGIFGAGTMTVESGATANTSATTFIANGSGTGTATVTGAGSSWTANAIQIATASSGSGALNVLSGGAVTTNTLTLNDPAGSATGTLTIDGGNVTVNGTFTRRGMLDFRDGTLTINAGIFDNAAAASPLVINGSAPGKLPALRLTGTSHVLGVSDLTVGDNRAGSLFIESRSELVSTGNVFIGAQTGGSGTMTVEGFFQNTGAFRVGQGLVSGGAGTLLLQNFGEVVVGTTLFVYPQGTVRLNNGRLVLNNLTMQGGTFDFSSGSVTFGIAATLDNSDLDGLLGAAHTLRGGQLLFSNSDFTLGANLAVDGGTLEAANDLIVSANTFLTLSRGNVKCSNNFTNQAGGVVSLQGGTLSSDLDMANAGEIQLHGGTSLLLAQNNLDNTGLITGSGQVSAALNNQTSGVVRATGTDRLVVTGAVNNTGLISLLNGGTVEFRDAMTNAASGRITGRGVVDARVGVTNNGQIAFSGELSDFFGPITNNSGGKIIVTGAGLATFYDTITHNAGAEIRVSAGSSAVFLGPVNGVGTFSGSGTKYFEGGGSAVGPVITPGSTVVEAAASLSAALIREDSLTVNGQVTINTSGGTSHLNTLNIAADGVLDLKNNSLVLEGGDLAVVTSQIRSGLYEGTGITSSAPASPFRLGSMSNAGTFYSSFQGIGGLDGDEVLIRYTRIGDLNLDGTVTISDFIDLASHFNTVGGATWQMGDVNYDGSVTISDFIDLASNFNQSVSGEAIPISDADAAMLAEFAGGQVPEPAALPLILGTAFLLRRVRRSE